MGLSSPVWPTVLSWKLGFKYLEFFKKRSVLTYKIRYLLFCTNYNRRPNSNPALWNGAWIHKIPEMEPEISPWHHIRCIKYKPWNCTVSWAPCSLAHKETSMQKAELVHSHIHLVNLFSKGKQNAVSTTTFRPLELIASTQMSNYFGDSQSYRTLLWNIP